MDCNSLNMRTSTPPAKLFDGGIRSQAMENTRSSGRVFNSFMSCKTSVAEGTHNVKPHAMHLASFPNRVSRQLIQYPFSSFSRQSDRYNNNVLNIHKRTRILFWDKSAFP
jgi:hypothetical protein